MRQIECNLTTVSSNASILAGAVSDAQRGNLFDEPHYAALLDRKGRIHIVRFNANQQGQGITAMDGQMVLKKRLGAQKGPLGVSPSSIQFYRAGGKLRLAAIDVFGTVVRKCFEPAAVPHECPSAVFPGDDDGGSVTSSEPAQERNRFWQPPNDLSTAGNSASASVTGQSPSADEFVAAGASRKASKSSGPGQPSIPGAAQVSPHVLAQRTYSGSAMGSGAL